MTSPRTLIEALQQSFASSLRTPDGVSDPVALLWTDSESQWCSLIPFLRNVLPQLYALGSYEPGARQGPVIWLKCVVDRGLPDVSPPLGTAPILYLPGVDRQVLRSGSECPSSLQPLIELQYRGTVWHQRNGREWTVEAFLTSRDGGLGLEIAFDAPTRNAVLRTLALVATEPLESLRGKHLTVDYFYSLTVPDPIRDLLAWMNDAGGSKTQWDATRWATFREVCLREFQLDPDKDGPTVAADSLLNDGGRWDDVWRRFGEAPRNYPVVSQLLHRAHARNLLVDRSRRPDANEQQEASLRQGLSALTSLAHGDACARVLELEQNHKERRDWVWAGLNESPLAIALEPLAQLAGLARTPLGGTSAETMASDYATSGWRCDLEALKALAVPLPPGDSALIARVVRSLYMPWLDRSARRFQELMALPGIDTVALAVAVSGVQDTCILFVDGLRLDVASLLQERLKAKGFDVKFAHRVAPLPTVTPTAKPVASPVHAALAGKSSFEDFTPIVTRNQQPATASRLREEMGREGVEVLETDEVKLVTGATGGGWTEAGNFDRLGHALGLKLAQQIETGIDVIVERVEGLLNVGWSHVRIVTDHGWLIMPEGLPRVDLPPYLTETKWARCAAVRGESVTAVPTYPWYWNRHLRIASPPGVGAFFANVEYAHGGVSLQECVIPDLFVARGVTTVQARVKEVRWRGMRCYVTVETTGQGLRVDLRLNWRRSDSSIVAAVKEVGPDHDANLVVNDDKHEGAAAAVVVLDQRGDVLDYKATTVGEGP